MVGPIMGLVGRVWSEGTISGRGNRTEQARLLGHGFLRTYMSFAFVTGVSTFVDELYRVYSASKELWVGAHHDISRDGYNGGRDALVARALMPTRWSPLQEGIWWQTDGTS
jgi:hypothetical protein